VDLEPVSGAGYWPFEGHTLVSGLKQFSPEDFIITFVRILAAEHKSFVEKRLKSGNLERGYRLYHHTTNIHFWNIDHKRN
jgi:hypothetical protein